MELDFFIDNKTIITNAHVIESAIKSGCKIHAKIGNNRFELNPISIINDDVNDFCHFKKYYQLSRR